MTSVLPFVYSAKSSEGGSLNVSPRLGIQQSTLKNKQGRGFVSPDMNTEPSYLFVQDDPAGGAELQLRHGLS